MQLAEEKVHDIEALKAAQAKLQRKAAEEIIELKKAQDRLIIETM